MANPETALINPYWDEAQRDTTMGSSIAELSWEDKLHEMLQAMTAGHVGPKRRFALCRQYAWAIPDPAALQFVAEHLAPRAVEMGAGTGYWASLLAQLGVDILAYDKAPPSLDYNHFHTPHDERDRPIYGADGTTHCWYPVQKGTPDILAQHADRALFLCWPPYHDPMATSCLDAYPGTRLVYIGEGEGGCTGDDAFHERLDRDWREVAEHDVPQWDGIHDRIWVYDRIA